MPLAWLAMEGKQLPQSLWVAVTGELKAPEPRSIDRFSVFDGFFEGMDALEKRGGVRKSYGRLLPELRFGLSLCGQKTVLAGKVKRQNKCGGITLFSREMVCYCFPWCCLTIIWKEDTC